MASAWSQRKRRRKNFGKLKEVMEMPNLIDVQKSSYEAFLQRNVPAEQRREYGLQEVLKSVFPIKDFTGVSQIEYAKYELEEPKYDVDECRQRGTTYAAPLRVTLRLVVWDIDEETDSRSIRDIKEQDVYIGDLPMMTDSGTFVINGAERVIVSQMHRSPGVFFDHDRGKSHASGRLLYSARIIPYRGSWLDFEFDIKDILNVRIDRRRKLPVTTLLYALDDARTTKLREQARIEGREFDPGDARGLSKADIVNYFYDQVVYKHDKRGWFIDFDVEKYSNVKTTKDLVDLRDGSVIAKADSKITARKAKQLAEGGLTAIQASQDDLVGRYLALDMVKENGMVIAEAGDDITLELLETLMEEGKKEIPTLDIDLVNVGEYLRQTMKVDKNSSREEALIDIYKIMRPGEPPTLESAEAMFQGLFFDRDRYDLSAVGRVKMNSRLGFSNDEVSDETRILRKEDILAIVKIILDLRDGRNEIDDIDHLGNRRVRSVGELIENQIRIGLLRMERAIKERMSSVEIDNAMPYDLINAKPVAASIREFFGSSQLSQFMDQTNPLSEITHKRRLSALGPGGLTRERAGFEVRDVHPTHYGRICPIETPEGPNIGLINSLATYARVNQYGFIETPYLKVVDGVVSDEIIKITAMEEGKYTIAEANAQTDDKGAFIGDLIPCRCDGDYMVARPQDIDLIDIAPKQLVSVAAALIPFLENDDANRALMGSNMQRQAVPLLRSEAPLVGTGIEGRVATDSGVALTARRTGIVDQVDATRIVIRVTDIANAQDSSVDIYTLQKFQRSNQNTCINQRPLVKVGDHINAGDIIADGHSTQLGELALGRNVLVAFMPWNGYNFEDSILISERIARDDVYTSLHIEEFEVVARDTKLGQEEITRDIPNVSEDALRNLDEAGIIYVGAEVKEGDILVGKVTPKGESPMTPEEKLLRAIFGEKASDVRDSSLRVPPGDRGTVVQVRVFSRRGIDKDERALSIEQEEIERLAKDRDDELQILNNSYRHRFIDLLTGHILAKTSGDLKKGVTLDKDMLDNLHIALLRQCIIEDESVNDTLELLRKQYDDAIGRVRHRFKDRVEKVQAGDELQTGVMKMIKVFVAVKRKLQSGDKMAGRHGNKGVVSRIMPLEDMPYLEDGTPVDIVLNPLGVPSRMNVGQILETHLGWACANLGKQISDALYHYKQGELNDSQLCDVVASAYEDDEVTKELSDMPSDALIGQAETLSKGVPIATPVFDGAKEQDIDHYLHKAGLNTSGQCRLIDGRTGEYFDRDITVGYIYMLKLHHLVDDKIHARSIGPYSLVTQQPLGGKAQFGGQRFGEMEVWALEAYGAAYTLQEMLTVKSDDVSGRSRVYEAIVRGDDTVEAGIPESFNVLMKEIRSLALNIEIKGQH